ncbi:MAG: hypothetical protein WCJ01_06090 [Ignavibacteria bacterium]
MYTNKKGSANVKNSYPKRVNVFIMLITLFLSYGINVQAQISNPQPRDGATNVSVQPTFNWINNGSPITTLRLYEYVNDVLGTVVDISNPSNSYSYPTQLKYNTKYSWFVKQGTGNWLPSPTTGYTFTTSLNSPTLSSPADATANSTINVPLSWSAVDGANYYTLEVNSNRGFTSNPEYTYSGTSTTAPATTGLKYNTVYYWRVKASNNHGKNYGEYSAVRSFTTNIPAPVMVYPIDNLDGILILPKIAWNWTGLGTVTYDIDLTPSAGLVNQPAGISRTEYQWREANGFLANGTTYTCRITAHQGSSSNYTEIKFKTVPKINVTPSYPANGNTKIDYNSVFFSWYNTSVLGNLQYKLQAVAKEGTTAPTETEWSAVATALYTGTELNFTAKLTANSKYWWRILVVDVHNNIISRSSVNTFITAGGPVIPVLSYPLNETVYTNTPTLYWYTNSNFDPNNIKFYVYIYAGDGVTLLHVPYDAGTALSFDVPDGILSPGTTYKWRLESRSITGTGNSSIFSATTGSFTTAGAGTVYKPTLSYPTEGTDVTIYTTNPTFYWYIGDHTSAVNYKVKISTGTGASFDGEIVHTSADQPDVFSYELTGISLEPGVTYYWKVIPNGSITHASNEGKFTVSNSLGIGFPVASYPKINSTLHTNFPTLYWHMNGSSIGIAGYKISWSTSATQNWPSVNVATVSGVDQISYKITNPLVYGTHYYWAVAGLNAEGRVATDWSSTADFTVIGSAGAGRAILSSPIGGITVSSSKPIFYWWFNGSTDEIDGYRVTYSRTSGYPGGNDTYGHSYTTTIPYSSVTQSSYTVTSDLVPGATYYWKVEAHYISGTYSSSSADGSFVVNTGGASTETVMPSVSGNVSQPVPPKRYKSKHEFIKKHRKKVSTTPPQANDTNIAK